MSLFWKKYKEYIITLTLACFGVALIWYGILPLHKEIKNQMNRSQEILTDSEIRDGLVANLSDLRDQKSVIEKNEGQLSDRVISKNNIVDLVKDIEALAKETDNLISIDSTGKNTSIVAISKTKEDGASADDNGKKKSLAESLPSEHNVMITITLTGKYNDIVRFIQKFESMRYETDIISLSLSVQQPTASSGQPRMNIFASGDVIPTNTNNEATAPLTPIDTALPTQAILNTVVYVNEN